MQQSVVQPFGTIVGSQTSTVRDRRMSSVDIRLTVNRRLARVTSGRRGSEMGPRNCPYRISISFY